MPADDNEKKQGKHSRVTGLFTSVLSFLRLFDKPTRALIVACVCMAVISLVVIMPRGTAPLMDGAGQAVVSVRQERTPQTARTKQTDPATDVKHASGVPSSQTSSSSAPAQPSWMLPSGGAHINLRKVRNLQVKVSIAHQRTYIMSGNTVVYTMICSTGMDGKTPTGTYRVQNRGLDFYNPKESMGAKYWVSWANYGEYLFHSVPTDKSGKWIVSEAEKLGKSASHGCVRLTVADAKWLYEQLPEGTKVVIA